MVVEGVDEHGAGLGLPLAGLDQALVDGGADLLDVGAVGPGRHQLGHRRPVGHVDLGADAEHLGCEGHPLGMVPCAGGDHPPGLLLLRETGHARVGAPDLEGAGPLEVLALEVDLGADAIGEGPAVLERSGPDDSAEQVLRSADVVQGDGQRR